MVSNTTLNLTAADVFRANKGVGPGFDALRLGLSVWVFTLHAMYICRGVESAKEFAANPLHRLLVTPVLPMFFLVSGYLVTGSAIRTRMFSTFLIFRAIRIVPALLVEVTLSALVLGPWLTESSLPKYFSDPLFYKYFLNVVGKAQFFLPGLFIKNPITIVNANMWTLKPEFYCYIFISITMLSGILFNRRNFTVISGFIVAATLAYEIGGGHIYDVLGIINWKTLMVAFVLGCLACHWDDWFVISKRNALIALLAACGAFPYPPAVPVAFLALTYIVVYIGAQRIYLPGFLRSGDYSYGIYLFGFPIQQTLVYFLPPEYRHGLSIMVLGLPLTLLLAVLSWNLIERPTLRLKARFKAGVPSPHRLPPAARFEKVGAGAPLLLSDPAIGILESVATTQTVEHNSKSD